MQSSSTFHSPLHVRPIYSFTQASSLLHNRPPPPPLLSPSQLYSCLFTSSATSILLISSCSFTLNSALFSPSLLLPPSSTSISALVLLGYLPPSLLLFSFTSALPSPFFVHSLSCHSPLLILQSSSPLKVIPHLQRCSLLKSF